MTSICGQLWHVEEKASQTLTCWKEMGKDIFFFNSHVWITFSNKVDGDLMGVPSIF
jgi:hypothetical protein